MESENNRQSKVKYVVQKQRDSINNADKANDKEFKLKSEVLINHAIEKSKHIHPEMLDFIDYTPKIQQSPPRRYSPQVCNRNTDNAQHFQLFTTKNSSRFLGSNTIVKSRNHENDNIPYNASLVGSKYGSISKYKSPSKNYDSVTYNSGSIVNRSSIKNSPKSDKAMRKSDLHKLTMFLKTLELLAIHWGIILPNSYRYRLQKVMGVSAKERSAIPKQITSNYFYHVKTLSL